MESVHMKVSNLRFGPLLKVRKYQEKKAEQELSHIREQKAVKEQTIIALDQKRNAEMNETTPNEKVRADDVQTSRAFIRKLTREIQTQQHKLKEVQKQEEEKTGEVIEKKKSKEMIETLEDKFQMHLAKERERIEQRLMDILAQRSKTEINK